jgi:hypothetical protein
MPTPSRRINGCKLVSARQQGDFCLVPFYFPPRVLAMPEETVVLTFPGHKLRWNVGPQEVLGLADALF